MIRKKPVTPEAARLKMADLCARGEHCVSEIQEKLRKMAVPSAVVRDIIEYLIDNRYIDEARYAVSFAHDKVCFSAWGKRKISMALRLKRIPSDLISEALAEIDDREYFNSVMRAAKAKIRNSRLDLRLNEDRAKLIRSLASKGFEFDVISQAISCIRDSEDQ